MKVVMYGKEDCPQCEVLANKLTDAGIVYDKVLDVEAICKKGFMSAPILEVDMTYAEAFQWVMDKENK